MGVAHIVGELAAAAAAVAFAAGVAMAMGVERFGLCLSLCLVRLNGGGHST